MIDQHKPIIFNANSRALECPTDFVYAVKGDEDSQQLTFVINKTYDGENLYDKEIRVVYATDWLDDKGNPIFDSVKLTKTIKEEEETFKATWTLNQQQTYKAGKVRFYLAIIGGENLASGPLVLDNGVWKIYADKQIRFYQYLVAGKFNDSDDGIVEIYKEKNGEVFTGRIIINVKEASHQKYTFTRNTNITFPLLVDRTVSIPHQYFISCIPSNAKDKITFDISNVMTDGPETGEGLIITPDYQGGCSVSITVKENCPVGKYILVPQIYNLTEMCGHGEEFTLGECRALFPQDKYNPPPEVLIDQTIDFLPLTKPYILQSLSASFIVKDNELGASVQNSFVPQNYLTEFEKRLSDKVENSAYDATVNALRGRITTNEGNISTNQTNIEKNAADISLHNTRISKNAADIETINNILNDKGIIDLKILCNFIYPLGTILYGEGNFDPQGQYGGTWVKIEGRFLLGSGSNGTDNFELDKTGGLSKVVLEKKHMPPHDHGLKTNDKALATIGEEIYQVGGAGGFIGFRYPTTDGQGEAHENMPPYKVVNIWRRTALYTPPSSTGA